MRNLAKLAAVASTLAVMATDNAMAIPVTLQNATATFSQPGFQVANAIDASLGSGWAIDPVVVNQTAVFETAVFETVTDLFSAGGTLNFTLDQRHGDSHTIGRFRLSATTDSRGDFADGLIDVSANWVILDPLSFSSTGGATMTEQGDFSILLSGTNPSTDIYLVSAFTSLSGITGLRLEVLEDASLPFSGPGRARNGNFVLTTFAVDGVAAVLTPPVSGVPEPMTLSLLGAGLAGIVAARRRRAKNTLAL